MRRARRRRAGAGLSLAAALAVVAGREAGAHALGQRYDLPVPLAFYLTGAAAAVAVSFVVIGVFLRGVAWSRAYPRLDVLRYAPARLLVGRALPFAVKLVSVGLLGLVVAAGLFGEQQPLANIAPALVWIAWWVGLAYVSAFVGDVWTVINPWRAAFAGAEALYRRLAPGRELARGLPYPPALGVWPAVVLLLVFAWIELVFPAPAVPANVAAMTIAYSVMTWTGMFVFGRERWLRQGEVFALFFGLLARFAPTEIRVARAEVCAACALDCRDRDGECVGCADCFARAAGGERELALRPYAVGLLRNGPASVSMTAFVLLMLAAVLYDGFLSTPAWGALEDTLGALFQGAGEPGRLAVRTAGLVVFWLLFLGAYLAAVRVMVAVVGGRGGTWELAGRFVYALVPIAIAYHLAHYLSYLLIQGQYVIPLASDPFGFGWDLFTTAAYRVDIAVVGARFAWYTAVIAIVAGHVIAVYLAHVQAMTGIAERRAALRSQYPMTALMVIYTVTSLSILAEPIVESRPAPTAAAQAPSAGVAVPADAVLPEPGSGLPLAVGPGRRARTALTYGAYASAYHDGTRTTFADLLYPYVVAFRWGVRDPAGRTPYDPEIERATALIRERLAGIRSAGRDKTSKSIRFGELTFVRELILVDVYVDAPGEDLDAAASIAPPWTSVPWHVIALMEAAVGRGWAAFSREEAERLGVPWLDLARDEALKRRLAMLVGEFEREGYVPEALAGYVGADTARARWRALGGFYETYGHFLVTGGPYRLAEWSPEATVLEVFRDPSYPLGVGSYDSYAIPRRAYIAGVERRETGLRLRVEVETIETRMRSYRIVRERLERTDADASVRQALDCRFLVVGADGRVVLAGHGRLDSDGTVAIDLGDGLAPGDYRILVALYLGGNTVNADIRRVTFTVPGGS